MKLRHLLTSTALVLAATAVGPAFADENAQPDNGAQVEQNAQAKDQAQAEGRVATEANAQLAEKRANLIEEAVDALKQTQSAIDAIEKGDTDAALKALAAATGKLEIVVARDPELALAPVGVTYITYDLRGPVQAVRDVGNRIEDLVQDGEFQAARHLLRNFASEIVIKTSNLPLATYPDAILEATGLLDEGKTDEALTVLDTALSTLVVEETPIPLPPLRAEAMIDAAKALLEKGDGGQGAATAEEGEAKADADGQAQGEAKGEEAKTGEAQPTASDYVKAARQELELAEALGYGVEEDFADLHDALDELEDKIEAKEDTGGVFKTLAKAFKDLRERILD